MINQFIQSVKIDRSEMMLRCYCANVSKMLQHEAKMPVVVCTQATFICILATADLELKRQYVEAAFLILTKGDALHPVIPAGMPESSHKDVKFQHGILATSSRQPNDALPSMELYSSAQSQTVA